MTTVGVSSGIFRDIFSTEPMRRIIGDLSNTQRVLIGLDLERQAVDRRLEGAT